MKKKFDYQFIIWIVVFTIAILASSCGENTNDQPEITITQVDTNIEYPYEWDTINYSRIISYVSSVTTSMNMNIHVQFNEEFVEIASIEMKEEPVIYIGRWTDQTTFIIDNNVGVININLKTGYMTINYNGGMKEIYTH